MTEEEPHITIQDRSVKSVAEKEAAKVYAEVIIDISHRSVDHPFTYRIPEGLCGIIHPGMRVEVPFGKGSTVRKGYVLAVSRTCVLPDSRVKEIIGLAEEGGDREETDAVHLALWMKERYGSTAILALRTVLPAMKSARPLEQKTVILTAGEEQIRDSLSLFERKHQVARLRLLRSLVETPEQPYSLITEKLHVTSATVRAMEQAGLLHVHATASLRNPVAAQGTAGRIPSCSVRNSRRSWIMCCRMQTNLSGPASKQAMAYRNLTGKVQPPCSMGGLTERPYQTGVQKNDPRARPGTTRRQDRARSCHGSASFTVSREAARQRFTSKSSKALWHAADRQ